MTQRPDDDPRLTPILLRSQLLSEGWHDRAITAAVKAGQLHRIRHGAYAAYPVWVELDGLGRLEVRTRAVLAQARVEQVVSHVSALPLWGVATWDLPLDVVHVTRPDGRAGRNTPDSVQHCGRLREQDRTERHGLECTSAARTCFDITTITDVEHALCVVNDFLHQGLVTPEELDEVREFMRYAPDTLHTDLVFRLADGRCESVGESRTLYLCFMQSLPAPTPQHPVYDATGKLVARMDFAWPEQGVWLEFDGRVKYAELVPEGQSATDVVLAEKKRQQLVEDLTGWRCIRVTWADLARPAATAARIRALLNAPAR